MITSKQRAQLRKMANSLTVTLHIGKDGITNGVLEQLNVLLENYELVKGKVLENSLLSSKSVLNELCEKLGADGVQSIGTKFVIYRQSSDKDKRKIVLEK